MNRVIGILIIVLFVWGITGQGYGASPTSVPSGLRYEQLKSEIPKASRRHFKKAAKALEAGNYNKADQYYLTILTQQALGHAHWGRAFSQWQMGQVQAAAQQYTRAAEKCDTLPAFLLNYADFAYRDLQDCQKGHQLAAAAYRLEPADKALLKIIHHSRKLACPDATLDHLQQLYRDHPQQGNIAVYYAVYLSDQERHAAAARVAQDALSYTGKPFLLKLLAQILANNGYFLAAAHACEKLTQTAKRSADNYEAWGYLEYKQGHYRNAVINYQKALRYKYRPSTLLILARLYHFYLSNQRKALHYCKAALKVNREYPDAYYLMAEIYRQKGDLKKALRYSRRQIDLLPEHPQPYYYHGKLYFEKKEYDKAVQYLNKAVEMRPKIERYRLVLAKAYAGTGQKEKAQKIYTDVFEEALDNLWKEEEALKQTPPTPR